MRNERTVNGTPAQIAAVAESMHATTGGIGGGKKYQPDSVLVEFTLSDDVHAGKA